MLKLPLRRRSGDDVASQGRAAVPALERGVVLADPLGVMSMLRAMSRQRTFGVLLALAAAASGCGLLDGDGRQLEADEVGIHVITRGGETDESVRWRFSGDDRPEEWGVVSGLPEATCVVMPRRDWQLAVTLEQRNMPGRELSSLDAGDFSTAPTIYVAIDRLANGRVVVTEGVPS